MVAVHSGEEPTLAVAPVLDIASNLFLAREQRKPGILGSVFRMLDTGGMKNDASKAIKDLGIATLQNVNQAVETLSGGQRQAVAVARAGAFGSQVVILDERPRPGRAGVEPGAPAGA